MAGRTFREARSVMAKGQLCPKCSKNTLQPYTTNQLKCSVDGTIVRRDPPSGRKAS